MAEEWRPVVGFEGRYAVSSEGRVMSLGRPGYGKGIRATDRLLRLQLGKRGNRGNERFNCWRVTLRGPGGKTSSHFAHRLVARAFLGEPLPGQTQVNHIDGDPFNNRIENLEWCTPSENVRHAWATGLYKHKTHCPSGHALTADNVLLQRERKRPRPTRSCRICRRAIARAAYARRMARARGTAPDTPGSPGVPSCQ